VGLSLLFASEKWTSLLYFVKYGYISRAAEVEGMLSAVVSALDGVW
jgi:hypothetical protein